MRIPTAFMLMPIAIVLKPLCIHEHTVFMLQPILLFEWPMWRQWYHVAVPL